MCRIILIDHRLKIVCSKYVPQFYRIKSRLKKNLQISACAALIMPASVVPEMERNLKRPFPLKHLTKTLVFRFSDIFVLFLALRKANCGRV